MKKSIVYLTLLLSNFVFSQNGHCDQKYLNKIELEKCLKDSLWTNDVKIKIDYIVSFKTILLPKFRHTRKMIKSKMKIDIKILILSNLYDSICEIKTNQYKKDTDKNNYFIQPKSYLSTVLSLELFKFYPDISAILLNPIHQKLKPITSIESRKLFEKIINELIEEITIEQFIEISTIVKKFQIEKMNLLNSLPIELFQNNINDETKLKYDVINFLIWKV